MRLWWSCTCTCTRVLKGNFLGKIPDCSVGAMHGFILGAVWCIRHDGVFVVVVVVGKASSEGLITVWVTWRRGQTEQWGEDGGIRTLCENFCNSRMVVVMVMVWFIQGKVLKMVVEIVLVHADGVVVVLLWHGDNRDLWFDPRENTRKEVNFFCWEDWIKLHEGPEREGERERFLVVVVVFWVWEIWYELCEVKREIHVTHGLW